MQKFVAKVFRRGGSRAVQQVFMQCSALCGVHAANLVLAEKIQLRCGGEALATRVTSHEASSWSPTPGVLPHYCEIKRHKYKYTNQIHKYRYTNTNTQIQMKKYNHTNTNTNTQIEIHVQKIQIPK